MRYDDLDAFLFESDTQQFTVEYNIIAPRESNYLYQLQLKSEKSFQQLQVLSRYIELYTLRQNKVNYFLMRNASVASVLK